jgi:hypothetical protein
VEVDEPSGVAPQANYHALMQQDGNFALLNAAGSSVWSTGAGATNAVSIFMQDDGNLVTYIVKWAGGPPFSLAFLSLTNTEGAPLFTQKRALFLALRSKGWD